MDKCQNCYQIDMFQMIIYYDQILKITGTLFEKTLRGLEKITGLLFIIYYDHLFKITGSLNVNILRGYKEMIVLLFRIYYQ